MDPDQFNLLAGIPNLAPYTAPDTVPDDVTFSAVDSSGNPTKSLSLGQGLGVAGTLLGSYGDLLAGKEAQQADDYNANLALEQGQFEVADLGKEETGMLSSQRAVYAKAGVEMSGSPLDTALNTASNFEMSKQIATYNAQSKANEDIYLGQVAQSQAKMKAGENLLSGAATLALAFL